MSTETKMEYLMNNYDSKNLNQRDKKSDLLFYWQERERGSEFKEKEILKKLFIF